METTPKRGQKRPGRHQWYLVRDSGKGKHRRTRGKAGTTICLRRGCSGELGWVKTAVGIVRWRTEAGPACPS